MPADSSANAYTVLGQEKAWNGRKVTLLRWDYSEAEQMMEVELDIKNNTFDGQNTYQFTSMERLGERPIVKTIIEQEDWVILRICNVPKRWSELLLRISVKEDSNAEHLSLYTNIKKVNRVDALVMKDWNGYRQGRFEQQITAYQKKIEQKQEEIEQQQKQNQTILEEIARLESEKIYQTEEEQEETDQIMRNAQLKADGAEDTAEQLKEEIKELEKKIRLTRQQIKEVLENDNDE